MGDKRAQVRFQIEAQIEIMVPVGAPLSQIDAIAKKAVQKEAGHLSADISDWSVCDIEDDYG